MKYNDLMGLVYRGNWNTKLKRKVKHLSEEHKQHIREGQIKSWFKYVRKD